jgi:NADH pyrophosphatase NudC (nudix superfamily)
MMNDEEIEDARWFIVDNLPTIPGKISIPHKLIDWFVEKQRKDLKRL